MNDAADSKRLVEMGREALRIEAGTHPAARVLEFRMRRVEQNLEQVVITVDPAAVFRRTRTRAVHTPRARLVIVFADALQFDVMRPPVAKVVLVHKA
jgi:hypothetical protein